MWRAKLANALYFLGIGTNSDTRDLAHWPSASQEAQVFQVSGIADCAKGQSELAMLRSM